jgi:catechol 2,3-dioxygenase-like lactoylglutathione lyase family enzyme/streptogramin lyase
MIVGIGHVSAQEMATPVYDAPDQAVWDPVSRSWFVSNLGGGISLERDGVGWIVKLDETGQVVAPRWVENLDAPSGMAVAGKLLYVVDRDGLYEISIATAKIEHFYKIAEPKFLNDVAIGSDGKLYVSDFSAQRIYRVDPDRRKVELFIESEKLDTPDGLYVDGDKLIVASWGPIVDPATFATSRKGNVLSVDLKTRRIEPYLPEGTEVGNLEGIAKVGDAYYITDWMSGQLLRVDKEGSKVVVWGLKNPTDPNYSEELSVLAIPEHGNNRVLFVKLPVKAEIEADSNFSTGVIDYGIVVRDIKKSVDFYKSIGFVETTSFEVGGDIAGDAGLSDYRALKVHMMSATGSETDTKVKLMELPGSHKSQDQAFIDSTYGMSYQTLFVKDISSTVRNLKEHKIKILAKGPVDLTDAGFTDTYLLLVRDPDGNIIEFVGPKLK